MNTSRTAATNPNLGTERLLRPDEVVALLGVPLRTIYRSRPRGYRIGRQVRYRIDDVKRQLEAHRDARR